MFATKFMDHAAYSRKVKKMSYSELEFTIKDCMEVLKAWPDQPNYGYYADEICYCADELGRRNDSFGSRQPPSEGRRKGKNDGL